jgi:hypothetical protein
LLPTPPRDGTLIRFLPLVASHSSFSGENINQPEITADFIPSGLIPLTN